jgi:hypothetical protein
MDAEIQDVFGEEENDEELVLDASVHNEKMDGERRRNVGQIIWCPTYEERVYFTERAHIFRGQGEHIEGDGNGFGLDDVLAEELQDRPVERVIIAYTETNDVFEFELEQFINFREYNGGSINYQNYASQRYVPKKAHKKKWPDMAGALIKQR